MTAQPTYYALTGGLDQESAAIAVPPGRAIAVLNHEAVSQGYQRTQGYERYDGHPRPSETTYSLMTFTNGLYAPKVGDILVGYVSDATARVLVAPILEAGAWDGTATGTLVVHLITGAFLPAEALRVEGDTYAVVDALPVQGFGTEDAAHRGYMLAARDHARSLITKVPGEGPVRGVLWFEGKLHAWRDDALQTAGVLHQSSAGGWTARDLGNLLRFTSGGAYEIVPGNTITGSISGATAVVRSIATDAGTRWDVGDATGTMVLDDVTGTFVAEELNVGLNQFIASIEAAPAPATFPAGGRYEFDIFNFYGSVGTERAYGVNGVGKAFEYDGDSIIPITTGMVDDRPRLIAAHKNHLFLAFPKGSLQHSDLGEPLSFTARLGAAELGMGHEITNLLPNTSATLLITTSSSLGALTGNDSSDWLLEGLSDEAGARAHTGQRIGQTIYLDERGIRSVTSTQNTGNFALGTYTSLIQKELDAKRTRGAQPVASMVIKAKDQYLLLFNDGTGLSLYFGRKNPEAMLFEYPFVASCCHVAEVDGVERAFVGAEDGFVYELNVGTSFDGANIEAYLQLPFAHQGGPRILKRYHKAVAELIAGPDTAIAMIAQFDHGAGIQPYAHDERFSIAGGGGIWGLANWAEFHWDSPTIAQAESYIQGLGVNMSLILFSNSAVMDSYILQGMTVLFSPRGMKR